EVRVISSLGGESPRRGYGRLSGPLPAGALGGPALGPDGRVRGVVVGTAGFAPHAVGTERCEACHLGAKSGTGANRWEWQRLGAYDGHPNADNVRLWVANAQGSLYQSTDGGTL